MNKIETGFPLVFRFDDILEKDVCDIITNYVLQKKGIHKNFDTSKLPWHEDDRIPYNNIDSIYVKESVKSYRNKINDIVSSCFNTVTYSHFSDLVLWRKGRKMDFHRDNGYEHDNGIFKPRVFSSVTYLNDDYEGGETVIKQQNGIFLSKPRKGSVVFFTSDDRCLHSVNEITNGIRVTLPIWFTTDISFKESD